MIWGAVTSASVGPLCYIESEVNAAIYQEFLEHFMLPSADKLYGDADFLLAAGFEHLPTAKVGSNELHLLCYIYLSTFFGQLMLFEYI